MNDGKHAWQVPSTLVNSAAYKVKITSTKNKKLNDSSDNNFSIKTVSYTHLTLPTNREV